MSSVNTPRQTGDNHMNVDRIYEIAMNTIKSNNTDSITEINPINKEMFIDTWIKFDSMSLSEIGELLKSHKTNKSIRQRIKRILTLIAQFNKDCDDYYNQTIICLNHERKTENIEYFTLVYGSEYAQVKMKKKADRVKGDKNPAYQHGGKFSPFSEKFVKGDIRRQTVDKAHKTINKNNAYRTRLSYWVERYGEEEGRRLYRERQTTFTLEKLCKKYGEVEGKRIFEERQERWLESFFDKSEEELKLIRAKQGFWRYTDPKTDEMLNDEFNEKETVLYVIEYQPSNNGKVYIKFGVTARGVYKRFPVDTIKNVLIEHISDRFTNFHIERDIKKYLFSNNMNIILESESEFFDGWTECVNFENKDALIDLIRNTINHYK